MESILRDLVGKNVLVYTEGHLGHADEGVLEAFDSQWVRVKKESGEDLYFSFFAVRIIKPNAAPR
jgi:hypothetical protein